MTCCLFGYFVFFIIITIINYYFQVLCQHLKAARVIFVSGVPGIYDKDPANSGGLYRVFCKVYELRPAHRLRLIIKMTSSAFTYLSDARLLHEVKVSQEGNLSVPVETGSVQHDVTGGAELKLACAVAVVKESKGRTAVVVCCPSSRTFEHVCNCIDGDEHLELLDGPGTVISLDSV